jgi:hypothetical protein
MVLPGEISAMFRKTEEWFQICNFERDKIIICLSELKYELLRWFADHETIEEDKKR